jgi:chromosomal replication initiation ATPase DnaA
MPAAELMSERESAMRMRHPQRKIVLTSGTALIASLLEAIRADEMPQFRASLAQIDALLLDDMDALADRPRTQQEVFAQLRQLVDRGGQVVLTTIDPRYGVFVEETSLALAWPDDAGRHELARRSAAARGLALAGDALDNLAAPERGPRELQGGIARIAAEQLLQRAQ